MMKKHVAVGAVMAALIVAVSCCAWKYSGYLQTMFVSGEQTTQKMEKVTPIPSTIEIKEERKEPEPEKKPEPKPKETEPPKKPEPVTKPVVLTQKGIEWHGFEREGKEQGRWIGYKNSIRIAEGEMRDGKQVGSWSFYHESNGQLSLQGSFDPTGQRQGLWLKWIANEPSEIFQYQHGKVVRRYNIYRVISEY